MLAITVETTVVNVALPTLNTALDATTTHLQWIVDAYNLAFAALVLAGGGIGDRYGRRPVLVVGLALFAATNVAAALSAGAGALIAWRVLMGAASALVYPTTLAILTDTYRDRRARAAVIGAWGAVGGLGVAVGPVLGGYLLEHYSWSSVFVALVPAAVASAVLAWYLVPDSRAEHRPRLDIAGLVLSILFLGTLVYTIIEAPTRGWTAPVTLGGFAASAVLGTLFVSAELRHPEPLIDVSLFMNPRFSAASGAVTVAFFGLFGFIFLITLFFQLVQGQTPLTTGVRVLPVAVSIALGSIVGTRLVVAALGTKAVVTLGLVMLSGAFAWAATIGADIHYGEVAAQMVLLGTGLGLTTAPATESIMGAVRPQQAGAGSALNDATRQVGGTLGVAVLGSIYTTLYLRAMDGSPIAAQLSPDTRAITREGVAQGLAVAHAAPGPASAAIRDAAISGFLDGLHVGCLTAASVCLLGAVAVALLLPARPTASPAAENISRPLLVGD
ncbi:MFS transporter [Terrabacter carboxydivorans]|uniref:MFS transporter n=1 Tax=Terrabacter carboxydivorans TaxID=619730 RepID=A0ABP5ZQG5_9MICO